MIDRVSDQFRQLGMHRTELGPRLALVPHQRELLELEPRPHRAADERVVTRRAGRLPVVGGNNELWPCIGTRRPEYWSFEVLEVRREHKQLERHAFVKAPDLVLENAMPAAVSAIDQQELDR